MRPRAAALLLAAGLAASAPRAEPAAVLARPAQGPAGQGAAAELATPAIVALRAQVQAVVAPARPPSVDPALAECATKLIVRWEVTSEAAYTRRYQGVICPGGASGPTRGLGWDDGHQTRAVIAQAWAMHPQLQRILPASGQVGEAKCAAYRATARDIITPYAMAARVFSESSLPTYAASARRALGAAAFDALSPSAQAAWVSTVYNRGAQMTGSRRSEMRAIRDRCAPTQDYACMAQQYRSMCRLWQGQSIGAGLCARYQDTARYTESRSCPR